jgi:uncharacterized membrane protein
MTNWRRRSRFHEYLRNSPWLAPAGSILVAIAVARLLRVTDNALHWRVFDFTTEGAIALLGAFIGAMLTFLVLVASTLLLVVQLASAALTPRIIVPIFRNPRIRVALSMFLFSYAFSIALIGRIDTGHVPQLAIAFAIVANVGSVVFFVYFVMSIGMGLRPAFVLTRLAERGRHVIFEVYPEGYDASDLSGDARPQPPDNGRVAIVELDAPSGVLLAFDAQGLIDFATRHDAVIELLPHVGDFVSRDEAVFRVHCDKAIDGRELGNMILLGPERTFEQDATLAFRNIVDIANKALSPAINDPTTAVLAIDQLQRLLRTVAGRKIHSGRHADASGNIRLLFPTPKWEQFVSIACEEIRLYGATSPRILQRLRTMLTTLNEVLPEPRRAALREELRLTEATANVAPPLGAPSRLIWD